MTDKKLDGMQRGEAQASSPKYFVVVFHNNQTVV
jgi:hypothetical protein